MALKTDVPFSRPFNATCQKIVVIYTQVYSVISGNGVPLGPCLVQSAQLYTVTQYLVNISQAATSEADNKQDTSVKYCVR